MLRGSPVFLSVLLFLGAAGCTTRPSNARASLNRDVASRTSLAVGWPQSAADEDALAANAAHLLAQPLTPDSAAAIALLENRSLRATFEDIGLSEAELAAAGRLPNPAFRASIRWPDAGPRTPNVEFGLGMDVLEAFLLPVRKHFAGEQLAATEQRVSQEALSLAAKTKTAAYTLIARQQWLTRTRAILDVNRAAADLAQRQYDAGNISRLDLLRQQATVQQANLDVQQVTTAVAQDRERLNRLMGLSDDQLGWTMIADFPVATADDPPIDQLEHAALTQRLDLSAAQLRVKLTASALELKRKTRLLPASVDLGIDTERQLDGTAGPTQVTGPNISLALPVFDQGQPEIARLTAQYHRAQDEYEALATNIRSEVREAEAALLSARAVAASYDKVILPQRRAIVQETLLQYNAMQRSNYELLDAQRELLDAERGRIDAWRNYWIARTNLERALGGRLDPNAPAGIPAADAAH